MKHFPVENRQGLGEIQDLNALAQYMKQFPETKFLEAMLDFHLLVFLATMDMLPLRVSSGGKQAQCIVGNLVSPRTLDL